MNVGDKVTLDIAGKLVDVTIISQSDDGELHGFIGEKTLISFKVADIKPPEKKPFLQSFFRVGPKQTETSGWLDSIGK